MKTTSSTRPSTRTLNTQSASVREAMNATSWVRLRNDGGVPTCTDASGLPHLLFEWVLSYGRWTYVSLALSETVEALVAGLQGALWTPGAVPSRVFRAAYDALGRTHGERADAEHMRLRQLAAAIGERRGDDASRPARRRCSLRLRQRAGLGASACADGPDGPCAPTRPDAVRRAAGRRPARMTAPSTQVTTLLTQCGLTTAARRAVHAARRALRAPLGDGDEQLARVRRDELSRRPVAAESTADACTARSCSRPVAAPPNNPNRPECLSYSGQSIPPRAHFHQVRNRRPRRDAVDAVPSSSTTIRRPVPWAAAQAVTISTTVATVRAAVKFAK